MKKTFKKALAATMASAMVVAGLGILPAATANAEDEASYPLFIAYGGDASASGDWGYGYASADEEGATTIKVGETATATLTLPAECVYTWYIAPVILAENVSNMDVTVSVKVDGNDVDIDAAAGDAWWYEGTGDYADTQAIRLYGGYNEWGTQYISSPVFTTIEYTVTLNSIEFADPSAATVETDYTGTFTSYIGFGADAAESGDWGLQYNSPANVTGEITQEPVTASVGDTFTIKASLAAPCVYTWWMAPVIVPDDGSTITSLDCTVSMKVDGEDVAIDTTAGDAWWYEGTGDYTAEQSIRLAGGYNEWGTQYIASPVFTEVEYTITINSAKYGAPAEEEDALPTEPNYDIITEFPATITNYDRADYFFPDAVYTVQNDVVAVTMNIAYINYGTDADGNTLDGGFNDWCANGVVVTLSDGTKKYYAFGGAQATWDISIETPDAAEVPGGAENADNHFTVLDSEGKGSISFVVDKGTTIAIYALGWEQYDGDLFTVSIEGDEAPAAADTTTTAATTETTDTTEKSSSFPWGVIPAGVVVLGGAGAAIGITQSKKKNK